MSDGIEIHESFLGIYSLSNDQQNIVQIRVKLQLIEQFDFLFTVVKIIIFALIASIIMEAISAAPVSEDTTTDQPPKRLKNTRNPQNKKRGPHKLPGKKNLDRWKNQFDAEAVEEWTNPCYSIGWSNETPTVQNYTESYTYVRKSY